MADAFGQGAAQLDAAQAGEFHSPLAVVPDFLHTAGGQEGAGAGECRALGSGARARRPFRQLRAEVPGLRQLSTASSWPKSRKAPVATTAFSHLGDEGVPVLPLAGVEGLADVQSWPAGPGETGCCGTEPVGPDGQVVAEPVDVDGLAAVFLLPDGQLLALGPRSRMGTFAPALSQPSGQEFLRLDLDAVVFCADLEIGHGACTST